MNDDTTRHSHLYTNQKQLRRRTRWIRLTDLIFVRVHLPHVNTHHIRAIGQHGSHTIWTHLCSWSKIRDRWALVVRSHLHSIDLTKSIENKIYRNNHVQMTHLSHFSMNRSPHGKTIEKSTNPIVQSKVYLAIEVFNEQKSIWPTTRNVNRLN